MKLRGLFLILSSSMALSACGSTFEGMKRDWSSISTATSERFSELTEAQAANKAPVKNMEAASLCPQIIIDPQLDSLNEYEDMEKPTESGLISKASLMGVESQCDISNDGQMLAMRLDLTIDSMLGPKARRTNNDRPFFAYPYFVAITDSQGNELAKEIFAASVTYNVDQNELSLVETINQQLPLNADGSSPDYEVHIGFQLTDEQLFYNASL